MYPFNKVKLPTTPEAFDALVEKVCKKYNLPDKTHAAAVISLAIQHLDKSTAYVSMDHFGHSVIKSIAYGVAKFKGDMIRHQDQVNQLAAALELDPNDAQARDQLQTAADQGSFAAKTALAKLAAPDESQKV